MAPNNHYLSRRFLIQAARLFVLCAAVVTMPERVDAEPPAQPAAGQKAPATEAAPGGAAQPPKMVRLEFQEQKWLAVLQWLAEVRHLNLDWQTLPEGTLNLSSAKEYSIEEAEDLINMQMLARGFTILQRGEVLRVVPLKNVDVTLVPRVAAEDLAKLPQHQFVRVTFPLDWMIAEEAANEFKPLVSPYGQLSPMASSNRLEAMDAVVNLREMYRLLSRAESDATRRERVAEFRIKHRKAEEVAVKVRQLLGLPPDMTAPAPATQTQLDIEVAKFRSEAVKQLGAGAQQFLKDKPPDVHLIVNKEENSIIVNGRPDKIEIARQAIDAMDKVEPPRESSWETFNRVKVYEVGGFEPTTITQLMQSLQERGNLDKGTRIQHEAAHNRLVVFASPEDQVTIANIIESFRTEERRAEVLPLGQIDAQYATKAIKLVLKNPDRPSSAPGIASDGKFQIEPDADHNRLLLWATPTELKEVREFLKGLGENLTTSNAGPQMHVVSLRGAKASAIAQRLKRAWKEISDAPLIIESGQEESRPPEPPVSPAKPAVVPASGTNQKPEPTSDRTAVRPATLLVAQQQQAPPATKLPEPRPLPDSTKAAAGEASPVRVIADNDDEMIIVSRDPAAAETAKQFIEKILPAAADVQVITLKHAQAALVKTQIDAMLAHTKTTDFSALNTEEPLAVEADSRMNRLMIQHASPQQMKLINELVPQLDQPQQEDKSLVRKQQIYHVERKRASEIAVIVKEVYRDLLSTSDKMFDARPGNRAFGYNPAQAATSKSPEYQGLLSVGADDAGNIIVLSAPAYLIEEVMQVVKMIDLDASRDTVAVVPVSRAAHLKLGEALGRLMKPK